MKTQAICLVLTIALYCPFASAQWVQTNGLSWGSATCFAVSGANLFAGTSGSGVFLSTNNGIDWTQVNSSLTSLNVLSLVASGANLFAGTDTGGIFVSTNSGTIWSEVNNGLPKPSGSYPEIECFAVVGTNLFAGTYNRGVFLSTNNGTSWTSMSNGLTDSYGFNLPVFSFAVSGTYLFAGTSHGVFCSTNTGASWASGPSGPGYVFALTKHGTDLFAGSFDGVSRSTDNGTSWTAVNQGLPQNANYHEVLSFAVSGSNLYAGTMFGGLFLSTNSGTNWIEIDSGLISKSVLSLCRSGTRLLAGTGCGLFVSDDDGTHWRFVRTMGRRPNGKVTALGVTGTELFVGISWEGERGGSPSNSYLFHSTDNGESWVPETPSGASAIAVLGTDVVVATTRGVFRSTDIGKSWTAVSGGLPRQSYDTTQYVFISDFAVQGQNIYAGSDSGVFLFTLGGVSWTKTSAGLKTLHVRALAVSGAKVFAGTDTGGIFLSTNNGSSWIEASNGLPKSDGRYSSVECFAVNGPNLFAGSYSDGVFLSTNEGSSWTQMNGDLTDTSVTPFSVHSLAISGKNLFAGTDRSVFLSTNGGRAWEKVGTGLNEWVGVGALALNETYLFAGTLGDGVLRRPLQELVTSARTQSQGLPHAFELTQNYPNPFNPSTAIRFGLPRDLLVSLHVFDLLGREVAVLVNEKRAAGVYEITFDGSRLASGVYFYRLQAGDYIATKKLLLLK